MSSKKKCEEKKNSATITENLRFDVVAEKIPFSNRIQASKSLAIYLYIKLYRNLLCMHSFAARQYNLASLGHIHLHSECSNI